MSGLGVGHNRLATRHQHLSGGCMIKAHHTFHQSGFTRPVFTQKRMKTARGNRDRHIIERGKAAEPHRHSNSFHADCARAQGRFQAHGS